ncbi:MAG: GH39 family glycosyl hydrolase [Microgenomates group bacterium]
MRNKVLILLFFLLTIIPSVFLVNQTVRFFSKAKGMPANILVDPSIDQGPLPPIWQALAQGGEEKYPFDYIVQDITALKPKYIRVDHIYDFYEVVKKENNQLRFDWRELDKLVDQILATGALPFFSLSYMPPAIAQNNDIVALPADWNEWALVVKETIQHYSGKNQRNLTNVIYEVWNEPDLFGNWKIGGKKDYRMLYKYAVLGATQTQNTNPFKIGGPSITAPYKAWVDGFLDFTVKNNLRLDFYSWHRYSMEPEKFLEDINKVDTWLFKNAGGSLEKFLTEWGSVSENSPLHDADFDAAHLVATARHLIQRVDLAFTFEIKDGPSPSGEKYWGRWGILTHEGAGQIEKKPKYYALELLNKMTGNRVSLEGEGSWVSGFATKNGNIIKIILTNLDSASQHFEIVPLTITNLENGSYSYRESFLKGIGKTSIETISNHTLRKEIFLTPNNVILIELEKA